MEEKEQKIRMQERETGSVSFSRTTGPVVGAGLSEPAL